ncbi:MAG TPA: BMP family protein [Planctomycetota bacterium]|nr:BMP family protein [Planctomycetota bacterium]
MNSKNIVMSFVVLALLGGGVAYYLHWQHQQKRKAQHEAHAKEREGQFKVALVTPGAYTEGGWNQNAVKALDKIGKELNAKTFKFAADNSNSAYTQFRKYLDEQKVNVIIGHAGEYQSAKAVEIAKDYPNAVILISGTKVTEGNVVGVRFVLEDATYVIGQLAALMSKTNVLGCVGPEPWPVIESTFYAFEQGAKSVKPDIKVRVVWTQSGSDIARAKEQTLQLISEGADFILHNADNAAKGVFEAVQANKEKGVLVFGSNDDQALTLPQFDDIILASASLDIPSAYLEICKQIKDGKFEKKTQFIGMQSGMVTVPFNKKLEAKIPADVRKKIDETIEKLKKGELSAPRRDL